MHANLHGMNAGMWDCAVDAAALAAAIPGASDALVSFVLVTVTDIVVKSADYFPYYDCPANCTLGRTSLPANAGASPTISKPIDDMSDLEVYFYVKDALDFLLEFSFEGARFMERLDGDRMPIRFRGVSDAAVGAPLRGCTSSVLAAPGQFGSMGSNAAANDPLFWVIHPLFDKAWHVLRLAPAYARWNMTWDNHVKASTCDGVGWQSATPFDGLFDGGPNGSYTNAQIWELFDPLGSHLPYVYDQYTSWGDCTGRVGRARAAISSMIACSILVPGQIQRLQCEDRAQRACPAPLTAGSGRMRDGLRDSGAWAPTRTPTPRPSACR